MRVHLTGPAIALTIAAAACAPPFSYGSYEGYGRPYYVPPPYPDQTFPAPGRVIGPPTTLGGQEEPYTNAGPPPYPDRPFPSPPGQAYAPPTPLGGEQQAYAGAPPPNPALAPPPNPAGPPLRAPGYVMDSAAADRFEIDAGMIARNRAQNPEVRDFADMMIFAHTQTTRDLMGAVAAARMPAPPPPRLTARQQAMLDQLQRAAPNNFDRLYMDQQVAAHQEALTMHRAFANRGDQQALRDFAAQTWPEVQMHLDEAEDIRNQQRL